MLHFESVVLEPPNYTEKFFSIKMSLFLHLRLSVYDAERETPELPTPGRGGVGGGGSNLTHRLLRKKNYCGSSFCSFLALAGVWQRYEKK